MIEWSTHDGSFDDGRSALLSQRSSLSIAVRLKGIRKTVRVLVSSTLMLTLCLLGLGLASASASSNQYSGSPESAVTSDGRSIVPLNAVSCPSTTLCVAVGSENNLIEGATTVGTYASGAWSWSRESSVGNDGTGQGSLDAVSCPSVTLCVAAGSDGTDEGVTTIGTDTSGTWSWSTESPVANDGTGFGVLKGVSCPSMTLCVAVGSDAFPGKGVITVGTYASGAWSWSTESAVANDGTSTGELDAVSCP
jgi:hypothetical protein